MNLVAWLVVGTLMGGAASAVARSRHRQALVTKLLTIVNLARRGSTG